MIVKTLLFGFFAMSVLPVEAAATLKGKIVRDHLGGPPIAGVLIGADGANQTKSTQLGAFTLVFPNKSPGQMVDLTVHREGLVVVNFQQLQTALLSDPSSSLLVLIMARESEREEMARRLYRMRSIEEIEASFKERLAREGNTEKQELLRQRDEAITLAEQAAESLAKARPGQGSEIYKRAMQAVMAGKVDQAVKFLNKEDLEREGQLATKQLADMAQNWRLRGNLLTLKLQFQEAEVAYATATKIAPADFEACYAYGVFLLSLSRDAEAIDRFKRCLNVAGLERDSGNVARALSGLGNGYSEQGSIEAARDAYAKALAIYLNLASKNRAKYSPMVAGSLNNMGQLYQQQKQIKEAQYAYEEALKRCDDQGESTLIGDVLKHAAILGSLGIVYYDQRRLEDARVAFEKALKLARVFSFEGAALSQLVAVVLNNLAAVFLAQDEPGKAREALEEVEAIYRDLARRNPTVYLPWLGSSLNNLALVNRADSRMAEAHKNFKEALGIFRNFSCEASQAYLSDLARVLGGIGHSYSKLNPHAAAAAFEEALAIYQRLEQNEPNHYQNRIKEMIAALAKLNPY